MSKNESEDYKRGWYDGYAEAKKAQDYPKLYPPQPLYTKTYNPPTTGPIPPTMYDRCSVCGNNSKTAMGLVCYNAGCPTKVTCTTSTGENKC